MALTGYTRNGYCVDQNDDAGSHHICINLSSTADNGENFCTVTGQGDWCSSKDMPCHENPNAYDCAIERWCVCQWAFASYLANAGGCDQIQDIVCDAINMEALKGYYQQKGTSKYHNALDCIVERCGIDNNTLVSMMEMGHRGRRPSSSSLGHAFLWTALLGAGLVSAIYFSRRRNVHAKMKDGFVQMPDNN